MLNTTYDVPVVKIFAFYLILLSCFLLAADLPRLLNVLLFNRRIAPVARLPSHRSAQTICQIEQFQNDWSTEIHS